MIKIRSLKFWKIFFTICTIIVAAYIIGLLVNDIDIISYIGLENVLTNLGPWGPVVFILFYIVGTLFFFPGSIITLFGGALFGPIWGSLYSLIGASIGALLAFIIARYLLYSWTSNINNELYIKLRTSIQLEGWRFIAITRLMPFIPFNLLNYILGITGIKIKIYFLTTIICIAPGTIAFTWIGAASRHVIEGQRENNWIELSLISIAAVATVVFLPKLIRRYLSLR